MNARRISSPTIPAIIERTLSLGSVSLGISLLSGNIPFFAIAATFMKSSLSIPPLFFAYFSNSTPNFLTFLKSSGVRRIPLCIFSSKSTSTSSGIPNLFLNAARLAILSLFASAPDNFFLPSSLSLKISLPFMIALPSSAPSLKVPFTNFVYWSKSSPAFFARFAKSVNTLSGKGMRFE